MENATPLKNTNESKSHLKVIKNNLKSKSSTKKERIYINTLAPNFSYINNVGKIVKPKKCILL
ncbi:MAG: hypothetical protein ACWA42_07290 [Lutibacter sp.]